MITPNNVNVPKEEPKEDSSEPQESTKIPTKNKFGDNYLVLVGAGRFVGSNGNHIATTFQGIYDPKNKDEQAQLDYHFKNGLLTKVE